jgi:hypothetical protein
MATQKSRKPAVKAVVAMSTESAAPEKAIVDTRFEVFLHEFARLPNRTEALATAKLAPEELAKRLRDDPDFSRAFLDACELGYDVLEDAAVHRAVKGWDEPVFDMRRGIEIGSVRKYSDTLLLALLKANRKKFRGDDATGGRGVSEESRRQLAKIFEEARSISHVQVG